MAIENLVQLQADLQSPTVSTQDLMNYANGVNPEVPSWLALTELNRRKQLAQTAQSLQNAGQPTVKDQIEKGLGTLGAVRPTVQQSQVSPTAQPSTPQEVMPMGGVTQPESAISTEPDGLAIPAEPVKPVEAITAAEGGLAQLPIHMFHENDYAGGGIIAFDEGGEARDKDIINTAANIDPNSISTTGGFTADEAPRTPDGLPSVLSQDARPISDAEAVSQQVHSADGYPAKKTFSDLSSAVNQPTGIINPQSDVTIVPPVQPAQAPANVPVDRWGTPLPQPLSFDEARKQHIAEQKAMGISDNPYAEAQARQKAIESRQAQEHGDDPLNRIIAQLAAFGAADPRRGYAYAMAAGVEASQTLAQAQQKVKDLQDKAALDFWQSTANAEDARKRGDLNAIHTEMQNRDTAASAWKNLQMKQEEMAAKQQEIKMATNKLAFEMGPKFEEEAKHNRAQEKASLGHLGVAQGELGVAQQREKREKDQFAERESDRNEQQLRSNLNKNREYTKASEDFVKASQDALGRPADLSVEKNRKSYLSALDKKNAAEKAYWTSVGHPEKFVPDPGVNLPPVAPPKPASGFSLDKLNPFTSSSTATSYEDAMAKAKANAARAATGD